MNQMLAIPISVRLAATLAFLHLVLYAALALELNVQSAPATISSPPPLVTLASFLGSSALFFLAIFCLATPGMRALFWLFYCLLNLGLVAEHATYTLFAGGIPWTQARSIEQLPFYFSSVAALVSPTVIVNCVIALILSTLPFIVTRRELGLTSSLTAHFRWGSLSLSILCFGILWGASQTYSQQQTELIHPLVSVSRSLTNQDLPKAPSTTLTDDLYRPRFSHPRTENEAFAGVLDTLRKAYPEPNIILIVLESTGSKQLLTRGQPSPIITPNLARWADEGIVFDNVYTSFPASDFSNLQMLTGGYAPIYTFDLYDKPYRGPVLPAKLQRQGYRTSFFASSDLGYGDFEKFVAQRGFDHLFHFGLASDSYKAQHQSNSWGGSDHSTLQQAIHWMDLNHGHDQPFFLQFMTNAPHHPFNLPKDVAPGLHPVSRFSDYQQSLHYVDAVLGELERWLAHQGLEDNTLILVTSDHGEPFGLADDQSLLHGRGRGTYDNSVKSFLLIKAPRAFSSSLISHRLGDHGDLMPTLLSLVSDPGEELSGQSLLTDNYQPRLHYFFYTDPLRLGLRDGRWKYIFHRSNQPEELFDMEADPDEEQNLAALHPEKTELYRELVAAWFLKQDERFLAQLDEKAALQANNKTSSSLPPQVTIRLGYLAEGSGMNFKASGTFNPLDQVSLQITRPRIEDRPKPTIGWLLNPSSDNYQVQWTAPSGERFEQTGTLHESSLQPYVQLNAPRPLEEGEWQVSLTHDKKKISSSFSISRHTASLTIDESLKAPLTSIRVIGQNDPASGRRHDLQAPKQATAQEEPSRELRPKDSFSIASRWIPQPLNRNVQLVLVSPRGAGFPFEQVLEANQADHLLHLRPPEPMETGLWLVHFLQGSKHLGTRWFLVRDDQKVLQR